MMIYIATPVRGDIEENLELARRVSLMELYLGNTPVCPHCMTIKVFLLNDNEPNERTLGQSYGVRLLGECDEVLVVERATGGISEGCLEELRLARRLAIETRVLPYPIFLMSPVQLFYEDCPSLVGEYMKWRRGA